MDEKHGLRGLKRLLGIPCRVVQIIRLGEEKQGGELGIFKKTMMFSWGEILNAIYGTKSSRKGMRVCFPATHKKMQAQSKDLEKHFESLSH
jgi:hypothetical protein